MKQRDKEGEGERDRERQTDRDRETDIDRDIKESHIKTDKFFF